MIIVCLKKKLWNRWNHVVTCHNLTSLFFVISGPKSSMICPPWSKIIWWCFTSPQEVTSPTESLCTAMVFLRDNSLRYVFFCWCFFFQILYFHNAWGEFCFWRSNISLIFTVHTSVVWMLDRFIMEMQMHKMIPLSIKFIYFNMNY